MKRFVAWTINRWNDIWKVRLIVFVCWWNARYIANISAISRKNKTQYSTLIVCITLAQYCIYYLMSPIVNFQVQKVKEGFLPKLWGWGTKFLAEWLISTSFSFNVYCSFIQWKTISGEEMWGFNVTPRFAARARLQSNEKLYGNEHLFLEGVILKSLWYIFFRNKPIINI